MTTGYYHIVSSLIPIIPGEPLYMTKNQVIETCKLWLDSKKIEALEALTLTTEPSNIYPASINLYLDWERSFRNRLVTLRCYERNIDPDLYTKTTKGIYLLVENSVHEAITLPPLEREKQFDSFRFQALELMTAAEHFNFAKVCVYLLKLEIGNKWVQREEEKGRSHFKELVTTMTGKFSDFKQYQEQIN